jgi:hypothetical protein
MTQADRDRLVTLKKAKKRLITQREAAEESGLSIRQVKRLLKELKKRGDRAVTHGLRGKPSNRKTDGKTQQNAVVILSLDFGALPGAARVHFPRCSHGGRSYSRCLIQRRGLCVRIAPP